ncbi:VanZ family protein [Planctomycetota bacterium]|nr:VanZ family protein [Planctomycetota bacterium]
MRALWIAFLAVATFGSLYPFNFDLAGPPGGLLQALREAASAKTSRGDVAGNFVLFLPIGLFGMLAMERRRAPWVRFLQAGAISVAAAAALQLFQLFLPSRDASLVDVVWNAAGTAAGAMLASLASLTQRGGSPMASRLSGAALLPLALITCWLSYRLLPYVPSIDLQAFKDSLKPIFNEPLDPLACTRDTVGWILMAYLLREAWSGARFDRLLPLMVAAVFALEVVIVSNGIDRADLAGAAIASALWFGFLGRQSKPEWALLALLAGTLAMGGLTPLEMRAEVAPFEWMPFSGFLGGSMYLNAQSALEKTFLYGSLALLAQRVLSGRTRGTLLAMGFVGLIEFAQTRLVGHTPEVTDPFLVLLASLAIAILQREDAARALALQEVRPPLPREQRPLRPTVTSAPISAPASAPASAAAAAATTAPTAAPKAVAEPKPQDSRSTPAPGNANWADLHLSLEPRHRELLGDLAEAWGVNLARAATQAITDALARRPSTAAWGASASPDATGSPGVGRTGPDARRGGSSPAERPPSGPLHASSHGSEAAQTGPGASVDPSQRSDSAQRTTERLRVRAEHLRRLEGLAQETGQSVSQVASSIIEAAHSRAGL